MRNIRGGFASGVPFLMIPEDRILAGSSDERETDVVVVDDTPVVEVDAVLEVEEHAAIRMAAAAKPPKMATFLGCVM